MHPHLSAVGFPPTSHAAHAGPHHRSVAARPFPQAAPRSFSAGWGRTGTAPRARHSLLRWVWGWVGWEGWVEWVGWVGGWVQGG